VAALTEAVPTDTALCWLLMGLGVLCLAWLIGLVVVLRGTTPKERAAIITAYGRAWPWRVRLRSETLETEPARRRRAARAETMTGSNRRAA
jgi:hypothetical protein